MGSRVFIFYARFTSFHTHASLPTFKICFFILFHSCCSHAWVFAKPLVHEFPISYSHTELYFIFSQNMIEMVGESPVRNYNNHTPSWLREGAVMVLLLLFFIYLVSFLLVWCTSVGTMVPAPIHELHICHQGHFMNHCCRVHPLLRGVVTLEEEGRPELCL